ncbi:MAG: hypothetical protein KJO11_10970, partial [Gemmatimonadetes bacterium]|nr:hypothetical protein [Gemmatimonadota bacterium]
MSGRPLCVGLVGGLLPNSPVAEAALTMLKRHPSALVGIIFWLLRGRAVLQREVTSRVPTADARPPYRDAVLEAMRAARAEGRPVVLVSTVPKSYADPIADELEEIDEVVVVGGVGTEGRAPADVARALVDRFGEGGFDFVGRSSEHRVVSRSAASAEVAHGPVVSRLQVLRRTLRVHQWLKNLLIFLPALGAQRFTDPAAMTAAVLAFVAFSLVASSVYVVNDALDLRDDRLHPTKST